MPQGRLRFLSVTVGSADCAIADAATAKKQHQQVSNWIDRIGGVLRTN
jgi:hypothetical protein